MRGDLVWLLLACLAAAAAVVLPGRWLLPRLRARVWLLRHGKAPHDLGRGRWLWLPERGGHAGPCRLPPDLYALLPPYEYDPHCTAYLSRGEALAAFRRAFALWQRPFP